MVLPYHSVLYSNMDTNSEVIKNKATRTNELVNENDLLFVWIQTKLECLVHFFTSLGALVFNVVFHHMDWTPPVVSRQKLLDQKYSFHNCFLT